MRVLLISANTEQISIPVFPLGLAFVATAIQNAGHDVKLINLMDENDRRVLLEEGIKDFDPEIIGISVRNIDDQSMQNTRFLLDPVKDIIGDCRNLSDAPIVLGGAGYSIFPKSALDFLNADMGIQGEGERTFVLLLERLAKKTEISDIPGIYLPGRDTQSNYEPPKTLNEYAFPLPDVHPWIPPSARNNKAAWIPFQTRRGCPIDCNYCSTSTIEGRILRKHTPDRVIESLSRYMEAGYDQFQFVDNTFNLPPSYAEALCDGIIEAGLNIGWLCIVYPSNMNGRLVEKMARAGCRGMSLGHESGSNKILNIMNKRFDTDEVRRVSELFSKNGINQMGFLMLGGPGEDKKTVMESLRFADGLNLGTLKITIGIRIYPYTALARTAVKDGIVSPDDDLLFPRFYMTEGLEDWTRKTVEEWAKDRLYWMYG